MKKITLFFVALFLSNYVVVAQSKGEDIEKNALNPAAVLDQLDQIEITSGILIDRSYLFSNHTAFYKDSSGINNFSNWRQLYLEIFNAQLHPSAYLPELDTIKSQAAQLVKNKTIPLLIMDITYQQIKNNAFEDSLLYLEDGAAKDVFSRNQSPYQTQRIITFSPATDIIFEQEMTFLLSKQFFFSNQPNEPQTIEIDFADGLGFKEVNWENSISVFAS